MSRKKPDASPDMFAAHPNAPAKKKAKLAKERSLCIAGADGLIAGLPTACESAKLALADILRRTDRALLMPELTERQRAALVAISRDAEHAASLTKQMRAAADDLVSRVPKEAVELF